MLIAPELGFRYLAAGGASLAIAASKAFVQRMGSARQFLIDINLPLIFGKVAFVMRLWKDLNVSGAGAEHMDQRLKKTIFRAIRVGDSRAAISGHLGNSFVATIKLTENSISALMAPTTSGKQELSWEPT